MRGFSIGASVSGVAFYIAAIVVASFFPSEVFCADKIVNQVSVGAEKVSYMIEFLPSSGGSTVKPTMGKLLKAKVTFSSHQGSNTGDVVLKTFDATMPGHGHGMVTRTRVSKVSKGVYEVEGVKFHMQGEWKVAMRLELGTNSTTTADKINL